MLTIVFEEDIVWTNLNTDLILENRLKAMDMIISLNYYCVHIILSLFIYYFFY